MLKVANSLESPFLWIHTFTLKKSAGQVGLADGEEFIRAN
jgi:hypothetical protein